MDEAVLISQVAYVLEHEWSFGMTGMWYVALVMAHKLDIGDWWGNRSEWEGVLAQFSPYHEIKELGEVPINRPGAGMIAKCLVSGGEPRADGLRREARQFGVELPDIPYTLMFSRQDVEELKCRTGDIVVSLKGKKTVITGPEDAPDVRYQLHLYREGRSPWEGVLRDGPWQ